MSARCHEIREALAELGPAALRADEEARAHVAECEACYRFLEAAGELDAALQELPTVDAPDALVERVLDEIRSSPHEGDSGDPGRAPERAPWRWTPTHTRVAGSLLAACLVLAVSWSFLLPMRSPELVGGDYAVSPDADRDLAEESGAAPAPAAPPTTAFRKKDKAHEQKRQALRAMREGLERFEDAEIGRAEFDSQKPEPEAIAQSGGRHDVDSLSALNTKLSESAALRADEALAYLDPAPEAAALGRLAAKSGAASGIVAGGLLEDSGSVALSPAARFVRERASLENVSFQEPAGYWANTYVPGDPVVRWLESRLEGGDRTELRALSGGPVALEAAARPTSQPFDPPTHSALAVYLHADQTRVERESRMLVQVGLQATPRRSGIRSAMNVAIVLDLRGGSSDELASPVRAVTDAFLRAKQPGDRFSLIVSGRAGARALGPEEFRHGPLTVTLESLFAVDTEKGGAKVLDLPEAVEKAVRGLERTDDPSAPLGSSLVVLVTGQPLGPHTETLARIAHRGAVAGIPTSVVGIGERVDLDEIERVILAGQGNRRLMSAPSEAEGVVARELSSLGRVVARAARLRIRLSPGVKLVDVIGSSRLDTAAAASVRQAEQSIDRRMARNLGIEADRGEDEEGIQIVIPTVYGGDSHVVLLDVVVSGPGPVADVTVRYKDLVFLGNGVARDSLVVGRGTAQPGPLERNVVKNLLATRLAQTLKEAGRAVLAGGDAQAIARLRDFRALLASIDSELPGFANDVDLGRDVSMLDEYLALIDRGALDRPGPRNYLADSMQLAGFFKTVPRLPTE